MAAKMIKFDLQMKGVKVTSFDELQENFSADILPIFQTGRLAKWLMSRELVAQAEAIGAIDKSCTELQQLAAICRVLELDDDEEVLKFLLDDRQAAQTAQVAASIPAVAVSDVAAEETSTPLLSGVDWSGQDMSGRQFIREDLRNANLKNTNFSGSDLTQANLTGADLSDANLTNANFSYANFTGANLSDANLAHANFSCANFTNVNLSCAKLNGSKLHSASFVEANLTKASLVNAKLFDVNLTRADLSFANLNGATFCEQSEVPDPRNIFGVGRKVVNGPNRLNTTDAKLTGVVGFNRPIC